MAPALALGIAMGFFVADEDPVTELPLMAEGARPANAIPARALSHAASRSTFAIVARRF